VEWGGSERHTKYMNRSQGTKQAQRKAGVGGLGIQRVKKNCCRPDLL